MGALHADSAACGELMAFIINIAQNLFYKCMNFITNYSCSNEVFAS